MNTMNYDTFKQHMKRLAGEYLESCACNISIRPSFELWLSCLPEPEKKQEKKWKPKMYETYYIPDITSIELVDEVDWYNGEYNILEYERGLCCKTPQEAIALAERMLEAIKN